MDFGSTEVQIVDHLKTKITDIDVNIIVIPEEDTEVEPKFGKRQIIVAFASEEAEPDENTSVVVQDTSITFSVLLQGKKLRGENGLYPLAEQIKKALIGFVPTDCRNLTYSSHRFVKNDKKVFEYVIDFKTATTRVEDINDITSENVFKDATYIPIEQ